MNRNWDIMRNAANGADPYGGTSRMEQTRMRDREHLTSRDREESWGGAHMFGEDSAYRRGGYGYERDPRWEREGRYIPSYGDEGFGRQSQGWGDYGGGERRAYGREPMHDRGMLGRMEQGVDRAFGRDWDHEGEHRRYEREGEHPSLWERVKGAFTGKGPKNWMRSDERIREDVCEALTYHPNVDATDIEVAVKDGEVTLTGTVSDRGTKRLAEDVADDVRGVKDVHNQIRVQRQAGTSGAVSATASTAQGWNPRR